MIYVNVSKTVSVSTTLNTKQTRVFSNNVQKNSLTFMFAFSPSSLARLRKSAYFIESKSMLVSLFIPFYERSTKIYVGLLLRLFVFVCSTSAVSAPGGRLKLPPIQNAAAGAVWLAPDWLLIGSWPRSQSQWSGLASATEFLFSRKLICTNLFCTTVTIYYYLFIVCFSNKLV